MRLILAVSMMVLAGAPAHAAVADYCAAYARDFADKVSQQEPQWQRRYDNAEQSCMFRFVVDPKPVAKAKPKPKLVTASRAAPPAPKAKPVVAAETRVQVTKVKPDLETGSPEWIDYCKKKYVSFNEAKGTYLSKTGIERKCLVTAD